jgi:transposase
MTYPSSFRRKVLSVREKEGLTIAQVAARFCVGIASVTRWINNPEPQLTRNKPATKIDMEALARDVLEYPDAYQYERARRLGVSEKGIGHALRRMGVTYKKNTPSSPRLRRRTAYLPNAPYTAHIE